MPNPYWNTADRCEFGVVSLPLWFLSVCCSVLLVMQSMGKQKRLFAVEVADIGVELVPKSDLTIFNNKLSRHRSRWYLALINTSFTTSLYSLFCLFMKRNLFIIILANRGTRWVFIFALGFLFGGRFVGGNQSPTTRWPDCCHPKLTAEPFNVPLSPSSLCQRAALERKKGKLLQERKNILKTFNCNPDAICTPLVKLFNNVTAP